MQLLAVCAPIVAEAKRIVLDSVEILDMRASVLVLYGFLQHIHVGDMQTHPWIHILEHNYLLHNLGLRQAVFGIDIRRAGQHETLLRYGRYHGVAVNRGRIIICRHLLLWKRRVRLTPSGTRD